MTRRLDRLACESRRRYATVGAAQRGLRAGELIVSCGRCHGWHRAERALVRRAAR